MPQTCKRYVPEEFCTCLQIMTAAKPSGCMDGSGLAPVRTTVTEAHQPSLEQTRP